MVKVRDVIILRINHAPMRGSRWTRSTVPGVTYRVVKVASVSPNGYPTRYWPYPGAMPFACECGSGDFTEMRLTQDVAQLYWRGLIGTGHFADFSTTRGAFDAVTGYLLRLSDLKQAV